MIYFADQTSSLTLYAIVAIFIIFMAIILIGINVTKYKIKKTKPGTDTRIEG